MVADSGVDDRNGLTSKLREVEERSGCEDS